MSPSSLIEAPLVLTGALFALLASTPAASASVPAPEAPTIEVVTTLGVLGSLAKEVGGEFVHVETLADARQDPHFVEPKPTRSAARALGGQGRRRLRQPADPSRPAGAHHRLGGRRHPRAAAGDLARVG